MNEKEKKRNFVAKLSEVLNIAKPHLTCEYKSEINGEFVYVNCENGYQYKIDVTANSLCAIAEEVFIKMCCK